MSNIEIKVGQKWRVVDADSFGFKDIRNGDVITIGSRDEDDYLVFVSTLGIENGSVELISDTFDSITKQIPPVGTKCLYSFGGTFWWECEVIAQDRPVIYCPHLDDLEDTKNGLQVVDEVDQEVWYKPLPEEKPKSTTQIRMEEIEKQMRELADELCEIKGDYDDNN